IGSLILLVVGISQAFTEIAYLLSVPIIITPITIFFVTRYLSQCEAKYDILNRLKFGTVILAVLLIGGLSVTSYYAYSYISNDNYDSGLVQMREIAQTLKAYDSDLQNKYVMAVHPASSYYLDSKFLAAPTYYEGDITGLVQYKGLDPLIKQFAPKYPSGLSALRADYLIYNEDLANRLPQYSYLFDPSSDKVPDNFKLVYWSDAVVVYEITK
ncbi:MAG: hypothetical protein Q8P44_06515, partial [Dehalococcoidia bacterium]|nr:hypothetical protein [Dehalococcoidia bacterium]